MNKANEMKPRVYEHLMLCRKRDTRRRAESGKQRERVGSKKRKNERNILAESYRMNFRIVE